MNLIQKESCCQVLAVTGTTRCIGTILPYPTLPSEISSWENDYRRNDFFPKILIVHTELDSIVLFEKSICAGLERLNKRRNGPSVIPSNISKRKIRAQFDLRQPAASSRIYIY